MGDDGARSARAALDDGVARALDLALDEARGQEQPPARLCLRLARLHADAGDAAGALRWCAAVVDAGEDLASWTAASAVLARVLPEVGPLPRSARVAVLGSSTTSQLAALLPLALARAGVAAEVYESGYGQYQQEVLDPTSGLHRFGPDVVVVVPDETQLHLPEHSDEPVAAVDAEVERWSRLWHRVRAATGARVVQLTVPVPVDQALGHLGLRVAGSRYRMRLLLDLRLADAAAQAGVALVDCGRLAARVGADRWSDARLWHVAKQAVGLSVVPLLARHVAAVVAAELGRGRKCLVLDLDGTVWGGVLGEDGLGGIALGDGPAGEAFAAFQEYALALEARGVVLAVCSKNDEELVREAFRVHPGMRLTLERIAVLSAGWDDKPAQLRRIAQVLGLGLDALVLVDDNPVEREAVRQLVPEVDVVCLPPDPADYVRALADYPWFEAPALTQDDRRRTEQYRARAEVAALQESASSLDDFYRSLVMAARVVEVDDLVLPRVAQLVGKTNQFNLTGRRRGLAELRALAGDPAWEVLAVRLSDRFTDHGVVGVLLLEQRGGALHVDTWLMSCRVIGRTLEDEMLGLVLAAAGERGCDEVVGSYVPSRRNGLVAGLYERLGFSRAGAGAPGPGPGGPAQDGTARWVLRVAGARAGRGFIEVQDERRRPVRAGAGGREGAHG
ncbi:HAD-IIIC family phosphatase [Vallicoccus soli]|uniref:HAD-IIIC family phosphatase n=1 Tax=Vallicoccus soli TaxID=2339232 RepID=A0A3A3Z373_9ACTN|nr:HAD-IIIC family phosphatase [Vallicoccus soli]RJK97864.1 HAD-IIIC family phosphatase [Vallicoccus soli]